jgi:hypothetical protein
VKSSTSWSQFRQTICGLPEAKVQSCPPVTPCPQGYTFTEEEIFGVAVLLFSVILALSLFLGVVYCTRLACKERSRRKSKSREPKNLPLKSILKERKPEVSDPIMLDELPPRASGPTRGAQAPISFSKRRGVDLPPLIIPNPPTIISNPVKPLAPTREPSPRPANVGQLVMEHSFDPHPLRRPTSLMCAPRVRKFDSLSDAMAHFNQIPDYSGEVFEPRLKDEPG